jgi:hypothetical protein
MRAVVLTEPGPVENLAIREAHADMEQNRTFGKMVVTISP